MSRQRFIYPEIFSSEDFLSLSHGARLLFIGMFATADDFGRGKGATATLQAAIFGGDKLARERVQAWADEVRDRGMARWYSVNGSTFYDLPSWDTWQKPKYKADSKIPEYQPNLDIRAKPGPNPVQSGPDPGPNPATGSNWVGDGLGLGSSPVGQTRKRPASRPVALVASWVKGAQEYAHQAWVKVHGCKPTWTKGQWTKLTEAANRCGDPDEFKAAWDRFLTETHVTLAGHRPTSFAADLDRWRGKSIADAKGKPAVRKCSNCGARENDERILDSGMCKGCTEHKSRAVQ